MPGDPAPWAHAAMADFTAVDDPGTYAVVVGRGRVRTGRRLRPTPTRRSSPRCSASSTRTPTDASRRPLHAPSHLNDARSKVRNGPDKGRSINMTGGWMDAGDQLKFTVTIAHAAILLQLAARNRARRRRAIATGSPTSASATCGRRIPPTGSSSPRSATPTPTTTRGSATRRTTTTPTTRCSTGAPRWCSRGAPVAPTSRRRPRPRWPWRRSARRARSARRSCGPPRSGTQRRSRSKGPWQNCCYQQDTVATTLPEQR